MKFTKEEELFVIEFYEEHRRFLEGSNCNADMQRKRRDGLGGLCNIAEFTKSPCQENGS
jgi:hypothetical protein